MDETEVTFEHIDPQRLVEAVKARPQLWYSHDEGYGDPDTRRRMWREVCASLFENFHAADSFDQNEIVKKAMARWKTARDVYMRQKKNNTKSKVNYDMRFLEHPPGTEYAEFVEEDEKMKEKERVIGRYSKRKLNAAINIRKLIVSVGSHPVLWDKDAPFNTKQARDAAWKEVVRNCVAGFEKMSSAERLIYDKAARARYKNVRDGYARNLKYSKQKTYRYSKWLSYLDSHLSTSLACDTRDSDDDEGGGGDDEGGGGDAEGNETIDYEYADSDGVYVAEQSDDGEEVDYSRVKGEVLDEIEPVELPIHHETEERRGSSLAMDMADEDWCFFNSLMPTLRSFTNYQKLKFRSKIMQYLVEVEGEASADRVRNSS